MSLLTGADESPWITQTTVETFQQDVIERSNSVLVVVDFWATWCGPCQELGPVLEKLAREYAGKFVLVKIDVDQQPDIAGAFGVQSIPDVFALKGGQPVNRFMGNLPEDQIRVWIDNLLPSPTEELMVAAEAAEGTDPRTAEEKYRAALELGPNDAASIGLARVLTGGRRDAEAREILQQLEKRGYLEPAAEHLKAELDLRAAAAESGSVGECRRALAADPDNLGLKIHLADALAAADQIPEALELCLQVVQQDAGDQRAAAKETMLKMFQVLGPAHDLAQSYRRKLATALY